MSRTKVVFLYTEIAGYFLACVKELSKKADVLVVRWPVNKEAPFEFNDTNTVTLLDRKALSADNLFHQVKSFNPDILVCSGWIDKGYLKVAAAFKKSIPVIVSLDNHWKGSFRQRLAVMTSSFYLRKIFTHAWVPGAPQKQYAEKLGFGQNILQNFYSADTSLFDKIFQETFEEKKAHFPRKFLYVARYVEHKGIFEMWNAFIKFSDASKSDWELWCIGTGDQWEKRITHPKIKHIGFVQPSDMKPYLEQTGIYILPSKFEPWGVTVHEFAVAGFPLLVSDAVGSASRFVRDNGIIFKSSSEEELVKTFQKIESTSNEELIRMAEKSHQIGMEITPEKWSEILLSVIKNKDGKTSD